MQADVPCLHVMVMQKLGQELALEFWGSSGKICVLPLQNCAVCGNTKMSETGLLFLEQICLSPDVRTAIASLLFLWLTSGLHHIADVLVTVNKLMVKYWKLLQWLLVCFWEGGICVLLWGGACPYCFWGNEGHSIEISC